MLNLYNETLDILEENGKTENDIVWFGHCEGSEQWRYLIENFKELLDFEYDDGFGIPEVDEFLYIVGDDWWLERHEYDGHEWWEYKTLPTMPDRINNGEWGLM